MDTDRTANEWEQEESMTAVERQAQELAPLVERARACVIRGQADRDVAMAFLSDIKAAQKRIGALCEPVCKAAKAAWDQAVKQRKGLLAPFEDAESVVKGKVLSYDQERERKRQAEVARLQAEADAKAAAERERALKAAERLKTPELREQRIAEAEAIAAPAIELAPAVERSAGESTRTVWRAELTDMAALVAAAAGGNTVALSLLAFDDTAAQRLATATRGVVAVPGVRCFSKRILGVRA